MYRQYWRKYLHNTNFCSKYDYTKPNTHITFLCQWWENKILRTNEFENRDTLFKEIIHLEIRDH